MNTTHKWEREMNECSWSSPAEFLWIYVMKGCGCGSSDDFQEQAWKTFENIALNKEAKWKIYDEPLKELITHWLQSLDLIEHGSSIAGSWVSETGKSLYKDLIKRKTSL